MLDVLIGLVLTALGFWLGRRTAPKPPQPPAPGEQEARRLREDRAAFEQLMGYNLDQAYGIFEE